jgi:hypothetical protein
MLLIKASMHDLRKTKYFWISFTTHLKKSKPFEMGYQFHGTDTFSSFDKGTYNFFGWHQGGSIKKYRIRDFRNL